jgi:release factor glutamine methyltransferase
MVVAELLLLHVLKCKRVDLYLNLNQVLHRSQCAQFDSLLSQRIAGKPVQYLTHSANFFGFELYVDENVLIPRPETEILVETVLQKLSPFENKLKIIDWGTGSANIAIALAAHLNCEVYAVDISEKALEVAERNVLTHGLGQKIKLLQGDGFSALPKSLKRKIDAVVSNPPYVKIEELESLPKEVRDYEPKEALFDKEEGLHFTGEIVTGAKEFLKKEGMLALEIALGQAKRVVELISQTKSYHKIEALPDLAGIERVLLAYKK